MINAYRIGRLKSKSILIFYVSSLIVVTFRVVLFTDVFANYTWKFYVIFLITMPTFLYIITGLSLVMCNFELIIKFKMTEISEENHTLPALKISKIKNNEFLLKTLHWLLGLSILIIFFSFIVWVSVCSSSKTKCNFDDATSLLLPTAILNFLVWFLMTCSTYLLVKSWRERFGS